MAIPCCKCGSVSLYLVGKRGFCREHKAEAFAAMPSGREKLGAGTTWDGDDEETK